MEGRYTQGKRQGKGTPSGFWWRRRGSEVGRRPFPGKQQTQLTNRPHGGLEGQSRAPADVIPRLWIGALRRCKVRAEPRRAAPGLAGGAGFW